MDWIIHGTTNCGVHVVMYSYFLLSSFQRMRKFANMIKPFLTVCQITQLVLFIVHCIYTRFSECPSKIFFIQMINVGVLVFFFLKFYKKSYLDVKKFNKDQIKEPRIRIITPRSSPKLICSSPYFSPYLRTNPPTCFLNSPFSPIYRYLSILFLHLNFPIVKLKFEIKSKTK